MARGVVATCTFGYQPLEHGRRINAATVVSNSSIQPRPKTPHRCQKSIPQIARASHTMNQSRPRPYLSLVLLAATALLWTSACPEPVSQGEHKSPVERPVDFVDADDELYVPLHGQSGLAEIRLDGTGRQVKPRMLCKSPSAGFDSSVHAAWTGTNSFRSGFRFHSSYSVMSK